MPNPLSPLVQNIHRPINRSSIPTPNSRQSQLQQPQNFSASLHGQYSNRIHHNYQPSQFGHRGPTKSVDLGTMMSDEQSKGAFTNMAEKGDTEDYELIDEGGEHMEIDHDHDDSEGGGAVLEPTMTNMNTDMNDTFSEIHHRSSQGGNNFDGDERMDGNSGHNKNIDNSNRFSSPPPHNNRNRFSSPPLQSNNRYSSPAPQNNSNRFGSPPPQNNSNRFSSPPPQNPASDRHHIIEEDDDDDFTSFQNQGDMTGFSEFTADMTMLDKIRRGSTSGGTVGNFEDEETLTVSSAGSYGDTKWSSPAKQPKGELARESLQTPSRAFGSPSPTPRSKMMHPPQTPATAKRNSPNPSRHSNSLLDQTPRYLDSSSSTPTHSPNRKHARTVSNDNSNQTSSLLLEDFTAQFYNVPQKVYNRPGLFSNGSNSSNSSSRPKTPSSPSKRPLPPSTPTESKFLLDFDIPPPATPRSIPSITPREVETLKSEYLTQLAGLKAEIKGKQVMVQDLKEAVGDAERRCGVYREELDNLKGELEDALNVQRQLEEKLGRVRGMIQELERNVAEAESAKRAAEEKAERAEKSEEEGRRINEEMGRKMQMLENLHDEEKVKRRKLEVEVDKLRTEVASAKNTPGPNTAAQAPSPTTGGGTSKEEVDRIAKELHLLYKQKHETKVAALKKSYEARWQKKIIEQEKTIAQLQETVANQKNMGGQNTTIAQQQETITKQQKVLAQQEREIETLTKKAEMANSSAPVSDVAADESKKLVENLNSELGELKKENAVLKKDLEKERKEKGELVGAVEEMLILQHGGGSSPVAVPSL